MNPILALAGISEHLQKTVWTKEPKGMRCTRIVRYSHKSVEDGWRDIHCFFDGTFGVLG